MITWLMVGLLLFTESACERSKNAVSEKNGKNESAIGPAEKGKLKATVDEEDIYRLTCYTCVNVSDNKVSKSCVSEIECSPASVGCVPIDTQKICISCCDTSYCNIDSPTNATNATFSQKRPKSKGKKKGPGDEENGNSNAAASSGLVNVKTAIAFFAISVFLNRAYH